jgi:heme oxygenase-like protein
VRATNQQVESLRRQYAWLVEPIERASMSLLDLPFFCWLRSIEHPLEFKPVAGQLFYHAATFPRVMGLLLELTPMRDDRREPFHARRSQVGVDRHALLMRWMIEHRLLDSPREIEGVVPTPETNACVNLACQVALERHRAQWLGCLNAGIECCSNDFFKVTAPLMHRLGAGDPFFDVHVDADDGSLGVGYLPPMEPSGPTQVELLALTMDGISLWTAMLHSWIGLQTQPYFDCDGNMSTVTSKRRISAR